MSTDAQRLAREIADLRREVRSLSTVAALGQSSIEGGTTEVYDEDGTIRQIVGEQADGSFTTVDLNAPAPTVPSAPGVTSGAGTLVVAWDGTTADGSTWPVDFDRVEVHVGDAPGFTPTDATEYHAFHTTKGGEVTLTLLGGVAVYVVLVAVNTSQVESTPSVEVSGTPESVVTAAEVAVIEADVAAAEQAAADAQSAATAAQSTADQASADANNITATQITDDAIETRHLTAGLVTAAEVAAGAVIAGKIAAGAVEAGTLAAGAVTAGDIAAGAVTTGSLAALAVTAAKIATNAVTADKIAAGAIEAGHLTAGAVVAGNIAAGAIDGETITGALIRTSTLDTRMEMLDDGDGGAITGRSFATQAALASINPASWDDLGTLNTELVLKSGTRFDGGGEAAIRLRGGYPHIRIDGHLEIDGDLTTLGDRDLWVNRVNATGIVFPEGRLLRGLDYGSFNGTSGSDGEFNIAHALGEMPNAVVCTSSNNGQLRHITVVDKNASNFRVRVRNANNDLVTNTSTGVNWIAMAV